MTIERFSIIFLLIGLPVLSVLSFYHIRINFPTGNYILLLLVLVLSLTKRTSWIISYDSAKYQLTFLCIFLYFALGHFLLITFYRPDLIYNLTVKEWILNCITIIVVGLIGERFRLIVRCLKEHKWIFVILFLIFGLLIFLNDLLFKNRLTNGGAHLFLSPSVIILGAFSVNSVRSIFIKVVLILFSAYLLYILGGRGTLLAAALGMIVFLPRTLRILSLLTFITFCVVLVSSEPVLSSISNLQLFSLSRSQGSNFAEGEFLNDVSAAGRLYYLIAAFKILPDNYFLGAPQIWQSYGYGVAGYPHNIISLWLGYGLLPALLLFLLILKVGLRAIFERMRSELWCFNYVAVYSICELILFKGMVTLNSYALYLLVIIWCDKYANEKY